MRCNSSHSWIAGCSTRRTHPPSEVFAPFLKRRISTRAIRHLSCWPGDTSFGASFSGIGESASNPTHTVGHTNLRRWKSAEYINQPTCALLHVLVLQRTISRVGANTPDTLSRLTVSPYSQHRQSWPYRTSAGRLDLQKV